MRVTWTSIVAPCVALVAGTATVSAGALARPTKQEARDHLDHGNRLYNTRSFGEAIAEFKAGALVEPAPVFDYNLGQAYRQLGKYEDALWHYDRFLTYGQPTGELLDAVKAFMSEMRAQLANSARTMPPNETAANSEATGPSAVHERTPDGAAHRVREATAQPPAVDEPSGPNWLGWGMTAAGVAAMGTAGGLFLSGSNLNDQANTNPNQRSSNDLHDRAHTRDVVGVVVGIGGVALTAAGVIDLLVSHSHGRASNTSSLNLGIVDHGLVVLGRF